MEKYIAVSVGPLVVLGMIGYMSVRQNMEEIKKDWTAHRCNPMYMPFVSMFSEEATTAENFAYCTNAAAKEIFARATDPAYKMFDVFGDATETMMSDVNTFLTFLAGMDKFIFSIANTTFSKLQNTFGTLTLQMGRIRDIVNRVTSTAYYGVFIIQTLVSFIFSVFNFMMVLVKTIVITLLALSIILAFFYPIVLAFTIPLAALLGIGFCFDPSTLVETSAGYKCIKNVQLGDSIRGSKVTGIFFLECTPELALFKYKNVIVSGRHIVHHNNKWMYVKDTGAVPYTEKRPPYLVCLNTSDNQIKIGSSVFRDYEETSDPEALLKIEELIWNKVQHIQHGVGLHPRTLLKRKDGSFCTLSSVEIGDELTEGKVIGKVLLDATEYEWVDVGGCVVSATQPIFAEKKILAREVGVPIKGGPVAVQMFIDNPNGWFTIHDKLLVREYTDSRDIATLEKIQKVVMKSLNKK